MVGLPTFETLSFFRGVSKGYVIDRPSVLVPRHDRQPRNSSAEFHAVADQWFENRFGIAYRSRGLFLTSRLLSARSYAASPLHVVRVVPLSEYAYCWSPTISDLLFSATQFAAAPEWKIEAHLEAAQYREDGLQEAHEAGHELMLYCDQYIAIPVSLCEIATDAEGGSVIIVPGDK